MSLSENIQSIRNQLTSLDGDILKAEMNNKAAGVRVRKAMLEIITQAKEARKEVIRLRDADK
jgi:hypothetical protein